MILHRIKESPPGFLNDGQFSRGVALVVEQHYYSNPQNPNPLLLLQLLILMNRFFTPWTPAELLELPF